MSNFGQKLMFDPTIDGRGIWILNYKRALKANTDELKFLFFDEMIFLSENYPCGKCRKHMQNYIKENPFQLSMNITVGDKDISCFKWLSGLHNSVNIKLGKPIMSLETALNLHDPINVAPCEAGCDSDDDEKEQNNIKNDKKGSNLILSEKKKIIQQQNLVKIGDNKPIRIIAVKK
jgi:hypothetical protein